MKNLFFLSLVALSTRVSFAQNSAVVNQQGTAQEVSIVQQGTGNKAVINQSTSRSENWTSVVQSGSGNSATIKQGNEIDTTRGLQNSVRVSQSGEGESIINQANGGNSIRVYQSGDKTASQKRRHVKKIKE